MVPFSLLLKASPSGNTWTHFIELQLLRSRYAINWVREVWKDGARLSLPYEDPIDGVKIFWHGTQVAVFTDFGFQIFFDGGTMYANLCRKYAGLVCGLCGRGVYYTADRNLPNAFVIDRHNNWITGPNAAQREATWTAEWRVTDDTPDAPPE